MSLITVRRGSVGILALAIHHSELVKGSILYRGISLQGSNDHGGLLSFHGYRGSILRFYANCRLSNCDYETYTVTAT